MNDLIQNPYGNANKPANNMASTMALVESERAIQEVQAAMTIAKKFPRNEQAATDQILLACCRENLANSALYTYVKGGQEITGPSIRLAEAIAQQWGNLQYGIRELSNENGVSEVETFCWDMEKNTKQVKVFKVEHKRFTRAGTKPLTDPREIYETIANNGARRLRACILGVIPGDVVEIAVQQCELTQANNVEVTNETIKKMIESFAAFGVTQADIEQRIGRHADAINAPIMITLRKIYHSLKDGMSKPGDWFKNNQIAEEKTSDLNETLKNKTQNKKGEQ